MYCAECKVVEALDTFSLCPGCIEKTFVSLILKTQANEGFEACFRSGKKNCQNTCKFSLLCQLESFNDWIELRMAGRAVQAAECNPECFGRFVGTCEKERCLFGLVCPPREINLRRIDFSLLRYPVSSAVFA